MKTFYVPTIQCPYCETEITLPVKLQGIKVHRPEDILSEIAIFGYDEREVFRVIGLDARNQVMDIDVVAVGTINNVMMPVKDIFTMAVRLGATSIILTHNHPTGDVNPSKHDLALTEEVVKAGKILNIGVYDHIIVSYGKYTSLRSLGVIT